MNGALLVMLVLALIFGQVTGVVILGPLTVFVAGALTFLLDLWFPPPSPPQDT